ncbi:MAG: tyrosine-type recombinase/integrase [Spiribacter salinus]|uniref:Tyrosine-type recombinase/integrase n=1 Tax=Spiribacter salinus TaxID=1335746 RepID=A0A540VR07_9GAMM|nr:MAG: tyrosine-type recombinase/integrase [Spiribacter salinus]
MQEGIVQLYDRDDRRKFLTARERAAFLDTAYEAPARERSLCQVMAHTGCLPAEIVEITAADIDRQGDAIFIGARDGHERAVPVPAEVIQAVDIIHGISRAQERDDRGASVRLWPVHRGSVSRWVDRLMKKADIHGPQASTRGLRYGFLVQKLEEGIPMDTVAQWLGLTTEGYARELGGQDRNQSE